MSVKACNGWVRTNKHLNVLTPMGHMESPNLVASCVIELDDTLPPYGCYTGQCWATHVPVEDGTRVRYDPAWLFDRVVNYCHSWCPSGLRVSCCHDYVLARLTIDLKLCDTLGHG
jgi:hypothetical protein